MATNTTSPNMGLTIPTVGLEAGPTYATDINNSLTRIDGHDHTPGNGVQLTQTSVNITGNYDFNGFFATSVGALTLSPQASAPGANTVYESSAGDLWYDNAVGVSVQITSGNSIAGAAGSIAGLTSPASASYSSVTGTFYWRANSSTPIAANMDIGALLLRNTTPNSTYAVTLRPPAALTTNYPLILPTQPGIPSFLTMTSDGTMTANIPIAGGLTAGNISPTAGILGTQLASATITGSNIASNTIPATSIVSNSITAAQIANASIFTTQIANDTILDANINSNAGIEHSKLAPMSVTANGSSGSFNYFYSGGGVSAPQFIPNASITITCYGGCVFFSLVPDTSSNPSINGFVSASGPNTYPTATSAGSIQYYRNGTLIGQTPLVIGTFYSPTSFSTVDFTQTAGNITYAIAITVASGYTVSVHNCSIYGYELR